MKKPDRFDRIVGDVLRDSTLGMISRARAIGLIRNEHLAVVNLVRKERREIVALERKTRQSTDPRDVLIADCLGSRVVQCTDILTKLNEHAK